MKTLRITFIVAGLAAFSLVAAACGGSSDATDTSATTPDSVSVTSSPETMPTGTTEVAVDLSLSSLWVPLESVVTFYIFGDPLPKAGAEVLNPTYEIETSDLNAPVYAAAGGRIVVIESKEQPNEYAITVVSGDYAVIYDHVMNLVVQANQEITAGTQLGTVGYEEHSPTLGTPVGRTEIMVKSSADMAYCPATFGTQEFNDAVADAAQRLNGKPDVCSKDEVQP